MPLYLADTNILLRFSGSASEEHETVLNAVERLTKRRDNLVMVPQNLYELWAVATRPRGANGFDWSTERAKRQLDDLQRRFILLPDDKTIFGKWLELVVKYEVKGKQVHDARLVAAMQAHGLTHLLTLNPEDFKRFAEVTPVHPQEVAS